ncbi:Ig-like domain-containing protein [Gottfriedia acidiceleris]|uniref:Ig-like domain-containing protein n=1 Tax=Gottfriedia acidiceleris TaxID=371036 RepID=UPI002FFEBCB4
MMKKGILSLATLGLLASPLSFTTAHAEGNNYEVQNKFSDRQFNNLIVKPNFNPFSKNQTISAANYSTTADDDYDYLDEIEPNNKFVTADKLPFEIDMYGQLLPKGDLDYHKIVVPSDGLVYISGTNYSDNINLKFNIYEKDRVNTGKLKTVEHGNDEYGEYYVVQAKAGTYYVGVWDSDNLDNNTEDDEYSVYTEFYDNVAPNKPSINEVENNDLVVTGKAEANSTVTVKNGSTVLGSAKATSTGTYSVKIVKAQKAGDTISVYAKDSTGNTSAAATTKVVIIKKPTVNRVDNNDKVVTGKAEANSTVTVKKGTTTLGTIKATSTGTFSVTIPVQSAGSTLTVTAKDAAGNTSVGTSVTVVDVIPPAKPTINRVDDNDLKVTGKAEKGSTVTVKRGTTVLGSATADSYGNYSVKIAAQKKGTVISGTAKDKAGNKSAAATYTVVQH